MLFRIAKVLLFRGTTKYFRKNRTKLCLRTFFSPPTPPNSARSTCTYRIFFVILRRKIDTMKKILHLIAGLMFALLMQAQTDDAPVSAGTDFYFTVFDHGMQQPQTVFLQIVATNLTRMTVQIGDRASGSLWI